MNAVRSLERPINQADRPMPLVRCIATALSVAERGEKSNKEMAGILAGLVT